MSNIQISAIPAALIEVIWPMAEPHIKRVVEKAPNELSLGVLKNTLLRGDETMIVISDGPDIIAVNTARVQTFDTGIRVLYIPITGGDRMDEWLDQFLDLAHQIARDLGCVELRGLACRRGWIKKLEDYDWYRVHEIIGCKVKSIEQKEV